MTLTIFVSIIFLLSSYIIGVYNSSYYYVKLTKNKDIRKIYSGTAGATNVGRLLGKKSFIIIFIVDFLKGFILPLLALKMNLGQNIAIFAILFCILGHAYPPQLNFIGGKGISIYAGGLFSLDYELFLVALVSLAIGVIIRKKIIMLLITGIILVIIYFIKYPNDIDNIIFLLTTALVIWCHRTDFTENK